MVSGVGPAASLKSLSSPVIANRPGVRQTLWDNCFSGPTYPVRVTTHNSLARPAFIGPAIAEYYTHRSGILTNAGGDFLAFERLPEG